MRHFAIVVFVWTIVVLVENSAVPAADPPSNRVIAMYFHRTQRCPTCIRMGTYAEEAVKDGFKQQIKEGTVLFRDVDLQDEKNAVLVKGYKINGPALIVAQIEDKRVRQHKDLKDIWVKVREKPEFLEYVRENVAAYLK